MSETKKEYLEYIIQSMATLKPNEAKAAYDTGYGLRVVSENIGEECHAMDLMGITVLKIRCPKVEGEAWYEAWNEGCALVRKLIKDSTRAA